MKEPRGRYDQWMLRRRWKNKELEQCGLLFSQTPTEKYLQQVIANKHFVFTWPILQPELPLLFCRAGALPAEDQLMPWK